MALLGRAALAMWWSIDPAVRADFEHWHAHEHFPERLSIPGFLRASRWREEGPGEGGEGVFVLYELADHDVLGSPAYASRLNAPSPWSARLMPHHRDMVRTQCRVLWSHGMVASRCALTLRLEIGDGREADVAGALESSARRLSREPGIAGLHLLRHAAPALAPTTEQRLRGHGDRTAGYVLVAAAFDPGALDAAAEGALGDAALLGAGVAAPPARGRYRLALSAVPSDIP